MCLIICISCTPDMFVAYSHKVRAHEVGLGEQNTNTLVGALCFTKQHNSECGGFACNISVANGALLRLSLMVLGYPWLPRRRDIRLLHLERSSM